MPVPVQCPGVTKSCQEQGAAPGAWPCPRGCHIPLPCAQEEKPQQRHSGAAVQHYPAGEQGGEMRNSHTCSLRQRLVYTAPLRVCFLLDQIGLWPWGLDMKTRPGSVAPGTAVPLARAPGRAQPGRFEVSLSSASASPPPPLPSSPKVLLIPLVNVKLR